MASATGTPTNTTLLSPSDTPQIPTETCTLSNGMQIPTTGHGTMEKGGYLDPAENARVVTVIGHALRRGLRLIDTAKTYATEELVGRAVRESDVPRDQITVVTKLWNTDHHRVQEAFEESLGKLMLDYIDIYIMHWPCALSGSEDGLTGHPVPIDAAPTFLETWRAMETLLGPRCRAIGVSNFTQKTLSTLLAHCTVPPVVNQIEIHPLNPQTALVPWCQDHSITVMAWGPLAGGPASAYGDVFQSLYRLPVLRRLAAKYDFGNGTYGGDEYSNEDEASRELTALAALVLGWLKSRRVVALPHSSSVERAVGNLTVGVLEDGDVEVINRLHESSGLGLQRLVDHSPVWNESGPGGRGRTVFGWTVQEMGWVDEVGRSLG